MQVDENAPVIAAAQIQIEASPEQVWKLMADIECWPTWNPDVRWASLDGALAAGTRFRWKAGPGTITSVLRRVEPPRLLAWTGTTLGIQAVHVWRLEGREGHTLVTTKESWAGLPARLMRGTMARMLQSSIDAGLRYLKDAAEEGAVG